MLIPLEYMFTANRFRKFRCKANFISASILKLYFYRDCKLYRLMNPFDMILFNLWNLLASEAMLR